LFALPWSAFQSFPSTINFLNAGDRFHPMRPILTDQSQSRVGAPLDWSELLTLFYYAGKGYSMHQIGTILHRDASTVTRNYNKFFHLIKGTSVYDGRWSRSRPEFQNHILTKTWILRHYLLFSILSDPGLSVRCIAQRMTESQFPFSVAKTRIGEEFLDMRINAIHPIKRPRMTIANADYRMKFVQDIWTDFRIFLPWLFTDEASIDRNNHVQSVRRVPGLLADQQIYVEREQFPMRIMVWGAISRNYKSPLIRVEGSINAVRYQMVIAESYVIESMNSRYGVNGWVFQHDGASPHRAKTTKQFLDDRCLTLSSQRHWPAHSPDLNVIENLWAKLKSGMGGRECQTPDALWHLAQEAWDKISYDEVNHLINDFEARLRAVEALGGQSLNGHRDVQQLLRSGCTVETITEMRAQETASVERFIHFSSQFFEPEQWTGLPCEAKIEDSFNIIEILPNAMRLKVNMMGKKWEELKEEAMKRGEDR
jgi:hypothetical protein